MAWIDDRIWCHPKFIDLSPHAFSVWVKGAAYATGFGTRGILTAGAQKAVGSDTKAVRELVAAGLWTQHGTDVHYHDWDDHNGKRDDRRDRERQRKREARALWASSAQDGRTLGADGAQDGRAPGRRTGARRARVDGSEGSDREPRAVTSTERPARDPSANGPGDIDFTQILKAVDW
jgi:hypothetical protein